MNNWQVLYSQLLMGNYGAIARIISLVENKVAGFDTFLASLPYSPTKIVGITGPPGAGKSTITDSLIACYTSQGQRVAVLCVDPSSPFNLGAILGDRIRMSQWYNNELVYIRSLATRGSLGGLHPMIIEITEVLKAAPFDVVLVETVGVGQSEIEIVGLADTSVVVLVPEAGDEIQTMKAGLMEIADIFVVNKADRPLANKFFSNLQLMMAPVFQKKQAVPILKTVATTNEGIPELFNAIQTHSQLQTVTDKKIWLTTEKIYKLIQHKRMEDISKTYLMQQVTANPHLNIYQYLHKLV